VELSEAEGEKPLGSSLIPKSLKFERDKKKSEQVKVKRKLDFLCYKHH